MFVSFWLWRQLSVNVIGGVLHFHGQNSYSAIVCCCEIVWNSVCGILVTRRADNKSLTTVEWRCLKTIFHWRLSTQLLSRLREVVWVSFWPPGRKSPLDSWEKECCQSNGRILCFVNWLIRSNAMSLAVPEINKPWFYFNTPKALISFPLNYTEQMACLLC